MSDNRVNTVLTAQDKASAQVNQLRTNLTKLGTKTSGPLGSLTSGLAASAVTGIAAGAAFGTLTDGLKNVGEFMGNAANAAITDEKSVAKLTATLKANVPAWNGSTAAIDKATEAGIKLGFADDQSREAIGKLVTATGNVTEAVNDYAIAQDLARYQNISVADAAAKLVKVHAGSYRALKELGIATDGVTNSTQALGLIQAKVAGQTEAYLQTTEGKATATAMRVSELQESFGYKLLPLLNTGLDYMADVEAGAEDMWLAISGQTQQHAVDEAARNIQAIIDKVQGVWSGTKPTNPFDAFLQGGQQTLLEKLTKPAEQAGTTFASTFKSAARREFEANANAFADSARTLTGDLAGAIQGNKDVVKEAMDKVMWAIKHPMADTKALAKIEGALTTLEYKKGLHSGESEVVAVINQQEQALITQWEQIAGKAWTWGGNAGANWAQAYNKKIDNARGLNKGPIRLGGREVVTGRASGGPVGAGETYLVGERGPELLHMGSRNGNITPNHAMGSGPIHVVSVNELARLLDQNNGRRLALAPSSAYSR